MQSVQKKVPMRKCMGCCEMFPKKELIRIVHTPEDEIVLDLTGKKNGRGAYLCKNESCLDKLSTSKGLNRAFQMNVDREVYERLREELMVVDIDEKRD